MPTQIVDMVSDASVLAAVGQVVGAPVDPTSPSGGISPSNIATLVIGMVLLAALVIKPSHKTSCIPTIT